MNDDPREMKHDPYEELTEDSDDALADLEKEFAAKKQMLLAKKAASKNKRPTTPGDSPIKTEHHAEYDDVNAHKQVPASPVRSRPSATSSGLSSKQPNNRQSTSTILNKARPAATPSTRHSTTKSHHANTSGVPSGDFGAKLIQTRQLDGAKEKIDYGLREYEFEDIPPRLNLAVDELEPYSSLHLQKRFIPQDDLKRLFHNIKILRVDKLLAKVVGPKFEEPYYTNWCLVGIVINKSPVRTPQPTEKNKHPSKYIKLAVGNFERTVDVMLFGDACNKFWKIPRSNVIAILNPQVSKFGDGFSLKLQDKYDSIIEMGISRDMSFCTATTKDNTRCKMVVDKTKTDLCVYHERKKFTVSGRMELNGSVPLQGPNLAGSGGNSARGGRFDTQYSSSSNWERGNMAQYNEMTSTHVSHPGGISGFSHGEYTDPKLLDTKTRKRKMEQDRSNRLLEEKLNSLQRSSSLVKKLGLVKKNGQAERELRTTMQSNRRSAFNSSALNKIGFDPTTGGGSGSTNGYGGTGSSQNDDGDDGGVYRSPTKRRRDLSRDLRELYDISTSRQQMRELTESKEDKIHKKRKWQANIAKVKQYKGEKSEKAYDDDDNDTYRGGSTNSNVRKKLVSCSDDEHDESKLQPSPFRSGGQPKKLQTAVPKEGNRIEAKSSDDDSDLEIDFGSEHLHDKYNKLIGRLT